MFMARYSGVSCLAPLAGFVLVSACGASRPASPCCCAQTQVTECVSGSLDGRPYVRISEIIHEEGRQRERTSDIDYTDGERPEMEGTRWRCEWRIHDRGTLVMCRFTSGDGPFIALTSMGCETRTLRLSDPAMMREAARSGAPPPRRMGWDVEIGCEGAHGGDDDSRRASRPDEAAAEAIGTP